MLFAWMHGLINRKPSPSLRLATRKRRGSRHFRPYLELLEGRTLPSITASIDAQAYGYNVFTGQRNFDESTSNPASAMATWQDSSGTVSAQSSGSFQLTTSSLNSSLNIATDEHVSGTPWLAAVGVVSISGSLILSTPSTVILGATPQFTVSQTTGRATGAIGIYFNSVAKLQANGNPGGGLDAVNNTLWSYSTSLLSAGTYTFDAEITTDAGNGGGVESGPDDASLGFAVAVIEQKADTTTTLTSAPNPSTYGQPVTFTATVTSGGSPVTSGTVTFMEGTTTLASGVPVNASGQASFQSSALTAVGSPHTITAQYNGTDSFATSSGSVEQKVSKAQLTVTANNQSKTYGTAFTFAGTEFSTSGLVNDDTVTSVTLSSTGADATASVAGSPYDIVASNAVGTGLSNYNITYVNGQLTVNKATLTVTADDKSRYYGTANPTLTYTIAGFVNGESLATSGVTGTPTLTTYAITGSLPGTYTIFTDLGTLAANNYTFNPINGTLTITTAPLSVSGTVISAYAGGPFIGTVAIFTTPDVIDFATAFTASIGWGDGSFSFGGIAGSNGIFTVTGIHTYADPVNQTVSVTIFHNLGYTSPGTVQEPAIITSLGQSVKKGLTGDIGFWNNKNGQALINSFNSGSTSKGLSTWLAVTFPNLYGASASANNLTGKTNAQVAAYFQTLYKLGGNQVQAQVLAMALNVFATTRSLSGNAGAAYGFTITDWGLGAYSYSVPTKDAAAFGLTSSATRNVYELLLAVNKLAVNGVLYNGDLTLQAEAADLFNALNKAGLIG
jgi:hypothetical protein